MANKSKIKLDIGTGNSSQHITAFFDDKNGSIRFLHVHDGDVKRVLRMAVRARMFMRYGINPKVAEALAQSACSLRELATQLEDLRVRNWHD